MKSNLIYGEGRIPNRGKETRRRVAFTLIELAVVLGVVSLLIMLLVPVLADSRTNSNAFRCLNNHRQLSAAWRMCADDNSDRVVYSADDGSQSDVNKFNRYAWTWSHMDYSGNNVYNWSTNEMVLRPLWPYTCKDASLYKCPSDSSYVVLTNAVKPRVRSFALNMFVGGFVPPTGTSGSETPPGTDGGWSWADPYRIFSKTTDLTAPGPGQTFLFIDERPEVINWGNFMTGMQGYPNQPSLYAYWGAELPGIYHNFGSSISFADGRAEIHRWTDPRTAPLNPQLGSTISSPGNTDIAWLQAHATSPK